MAEAGSPVRSGNEQLRIIGFAALLLFTIIAAFIVLKTVRDALVLVHYSPEELPYFMVATTLAVGLVVWLQLRAQKRLSLCRTVAATQVIFAAGTMVFRYAVLREWSFALPLFYVWVGVYGTLAPVLAWSIIGTRLLTREAKRAIGVIGGGAVAGSILGGVASERVAHLGNVHDLISVAAVLMLFSVVSISGLGLCPRVMPRESDTEDPDPPPIQRRFVVILLLIVSAGSMVSTFAEFQFKITAQRDLNDLRSLAEFFGWFHAYLGVGTLLFQLIATPLLLRWGGLALAFAVMPVALLVGNGLILAYGTLWAAVVMRGGEQVFKHSIDRSAFEVLFTAIPAKGRMRLKSLVDAIGVRAAESLAGIALIIIFSIAHLSIRSISSMSLLLVVCWLTAAVLLSKEYKSVLVDSVQRGRIDLEYVRSRLFGHEFKALFPRMLKTMSAKTWLSLLDLMETGQTMGLGNELSLLLRHDDARVRRKALHLLFSDKQDFSNQVEPLINDADRVVRMEAVRYLCSHSAQPLERLMSFMQDEDSTVQVAACSCTLLHEEEASRGIAGQRLLDLLQKSYDPDRPETRLEMAYVLEHFTDQRATLQVAEKLLSDPSLEVRKATVRSTAQTRHPEVLPLLLKSWTDRALWADLRGALSGFDSSLLPAVTPILDDPQSAIELKRLVLQALSDIGGNDAVRCLLQQAAADDPGLRYTAIKGLNHLQLREPLTAYRTDIERLLTAEIDALAVENQRIHSFGPQPSALLEKVFLHERRWFENRIFRLLGLLYNPESIYNAYLAFSGEDPRLADQAVELLDSVLELDHRRRIIRLLEPEPAASDRLFGTEERKTALFEFLRGRDPLLASAALVDLTTLELNLWRKELYEALALFDSGSIAHETADWRYAQMDNSTNKQDGSLTTIEKLESLSRVDIFSRLGPPELLVLASRSIVEEYPVGHLIYSAGETAHHIYNLISGRVELRRESGQAEEVGPGGSFGALAVLGRQPRFFSVVVLEKCRCIKVDRDAFWEMVEDYPNASRGIFEVLAKQILRLMNRISG